MGVLIQLQAFSCRTCQAVSRVLVSEGCALVAQAGCDHAGEADMVVIK